MRTQAPSTASTARVGVPGGLAECLPLIPETDVVTTFPIASLASTFPAGPGGGLLAEQTCWNGWVPA